MSTSIQEVVTSGNQRVPAVTSGNQESPPLGDAGAREQSSGKEEEKKKIKKKKETRLAPLELVQRILDDLNSRAGTGYQARGKVARRLIAARMADGFTEADFYEVDRKKCAGWLGTDMQGNLTYETLYGPKFEKYLGQLEKKKGQRSMFNGPTPQHKQQDYTPKKRDDGNAW
jgi:uncharacterized phage protein (TIGR02220 family)